MHITFRDGGAALAAFFVAIGAQAAMSRWPDYKDVWEVVFYISAAFVSAIVILWVKDACCVVQTWLKSRSQPAVSPWPMTETSSQWKPVVGGTIDLNLPNPLLKIDEPSKEFISVENAVTLVNDKLWGTPYAETILGWSKGYSEENDQIAMAGRVLSGVITLYGVKSLTSVRRPIDTSSLEVTMAEWTDRGSILRKMNTKQVLYSELAFKKSDVDEFIERTLRGD